MSSIGKLFDYIKVFRVHRTVNFSFSLLGALYANNFALNTPLFLGFIKIYILFGLLLYSGLYGLNGYAERVDDFLDKNKKNRLIPSGKVSPGEVLLVSLILISSSLIIGYVFFRNLFPFQLYFLVINLLYTFVLKKISSPLSIIAVATTGPAKFLLGYYFVSGGIFPAFPYISLIHYLCSIAYHYRKFGYFRRIKINIADLVNKILFIVIFLIIPYQMLKTSWFVLVLFLPAFFDYLMYYSSRSYRQMVQARWNQD